MNPKTRKMPSGKVIKFWMENEAPMFAFCENCDWTGEEAEFVIKGYPSIQHCPKCDSENVAVYVICPECLSPNKRGTQAAYLVEERAWPCEECQAKMNTQFDHGDPDEEYNQKKHREEN